MSNVLEVRNLTKIYPKFSLKDISFEIPKGYIMGFIGPNGAGKTTTLKAILAMINYQSGEIKLLGEDNAAGSLNERVGIVMDTTLYVEEWTMKDVEKAISPFYKRWDSEKYTQLLNRFKIDKKKTVKELSRGMKVKVV